MVAGFSVPAPTSVLKGCTIMQPRSVQYFVNASNASCMVSTTKTSRGSEPKSLKHEVYSPRPTPRTTFPSGQTAVGTTGAGGGARRRVAE